MHLVSPLVLCIVGAGHNREANLIAKALVNHVAKMWNAIIVARRFTLKVIDTNGRK